jgi:DNA helicase-2/ATP-dependent DNA helicase PcrA
MAEERRLCYVGMTRARTRLILTGAARRRVFGEYQSMEPSRFMDEVPPQLVERVEPAYPAPSYQGSFGGFGSRATAYGRISTYHRPGHPSERLGTHPSTRPGSGPSTKLGAGTREGSAYAYEDEDQSSLAAGLKLGAKVRHPMFGVGTILSIEDLADDVKLVVRFSVGPKTLRAKYAKLEMI